MEQVERVRRIVRGSEPLPEAATGRGVTGCPLGCGPHGHEEGCWVGRPIPGDAELFIDRQLRWHWIPRRRPANRLTVPRRGCCWICGQALDSAAAKAGDTRCTSCYLVIMGRVRAQVLGPASPRPKER